MKQCGSNGVTLEDNEAVPIPAHGSAWRWHVVTGVVYGGGGGRLKQLKKQS